MEIPTYMRCSGLLVFIFSAFSSPDVALNPAFAPRRAIGLYGPTRSEIYTGCLQRLYSL